MCRYYCRNCNNNWKDDDCNCPDKIKNTYNCLKCHQIIYPADKKKDWVRDELKAKL
jgi:hypothetical protein